ncbi:MAG: alpha/beta fold hydrolase, partial [Oscillospiraceae bacterium]|nr:alpha/beta fold hydrolase [Oscillospiraceae bacterium]
DLGYFGEKDGWMDFITDCRSLTDIAREEYPGKPLVFFGHSMGSFIARNYTAKYNDVQAAIYCGTSGKNPAAGIAIKLAAFVAKSKGSRYRSHFIDKLAFGTYNKKFDDVQTPFDWLTRDREQVQKYIDDKYCGFLFTAVGYRDLFSVLNSVSGSDWYQQLSTEFPVLVVSGSMDPVGDYSKGVEQVADDLKATGHNVTLKLFEDGRHEILNETNREEVENYIADWADGVIDPISK